MSEVPLFFARGMPPSSDERERDGERETEKERERATLIVIHCQFMQGTQ